MLAHALPGARRQVGVEVVEHLADEHGHLVLVDLEVVGRHGTRWTPATSPVRASTALANTASVAAWPESHCSTTPIRSEAAASGVHAARQSSRPDSTS